MQHNINLMIVLTVLVSRPTTTRHCVSFESESELLLSELCPPHPSAPYLARELTVLNQTMLVLLLVLAKCVKFLHRRSWFFKSTRSGIANKPAENRRWKRRHRFHVISKTMSKQWYWVYYWIKNNTTIPLPSDQMQIRIGFVAAIIAVGYDKSLPYFPK